MGRKEGKKTSHATAAAAAAAAAAPSSPPATAAAASSSFAFLSCSLATALCPARLMLLRTRALMRFLFCCSR